MDSRSDDEFDDPIEIDETMLAPGKELKPAPPSVTPYQQWIAEPMPSVLSPAWVEGQLHKEVWKANRSAINPKSIVFMAKLRAQGLSKKGVMARLGLSQGTWGSWQQKAKEGEQPYLLWSLCVAHAEADMEEEMLDNVRNAAQGDWKAATWFLSKMQPEDYNEKTGGTTINVHGDVNTQQNTVNSLSRDDIGGIMDVFKEIGVDKKVVAVEAEVVEDEG